MAGADRCLSESDFKALVKELVASLDYLPWIWGRAEGVVKCLRFHGKYLIHFREHNRRRPVSDLQERY